MTATHWNLALASVLAAAAVAIGCGKPAGNGGEVDAGEAVAPDAGAPCHATPKPADRARKVILAHPYDSAGNQANVYDVIDLSASGELTQPSPRQSFTMGRGYMGRIAFTPDGEIGVAVQDDGSIGIFRFDETGAVQVVNPAFTDGLYGNLVVMDPSAERFYVVNSGWKENGGGIYSVRLACDGTPTNEGLLLPTKGAYGFSFMPSRPGEAFLFAREVVSAGTDAHLLSWTASPSIIGSAQAFPDTDDLVSDVAVTPDGRWALVADNNPFATTGTRVAVVELQAQAVRAAQLLSPFKDPAQVLASPYGNAAMVVSFEGNAVYRLGIDAANEAAPFSIAGEISYSGTKPQLPGSAVVLDRGALRGRVLIAELAGIRQVRFEADGSITDLGLTNFLSGSESITGAIGVQP